MSLSEAIAALGSGPLTEDGLRAHIFPLFSHTIARPGIYLANHSLGRPLNQTRDDVRECIELWQSHLGDAWDGWMAEHQAHRSRIAQLVGAPRPDCIIPKTSAGQGLRTVLNALPGTPRVLSTDAEFDSVDVILKQYAAVGRIQLELVSIHTAEGRLDLSRLFDKIGTGIDLAVVSQVLFATGELLPNLDALAAHCHQHGARLLVDAYHAIGALPVDVTAMGADFMIGGSYKYLRGGPGACFLYLSPDALASGLRPLDIGWFAKEQPFLYERPDRPRFAAGGDAFLESTPPVLTWYQARAGQQFTLGLGVERLRDYSLDRLRRLKRYLAAHGVESQGADDAHGAFLTVEHSAAPALADELREHNIITDARDRWLRLCPDCLTLDGALADTAATVAAVLRTRGAEA
jgi:kynureninase